MKRRDTSTWESYFLGKDFTEIGQDEACRLEIEMFVKAGLDFDPYGDHNQLDDIETARHAYLSGKITLVELLAIAFGTGVYHAWSLRQFRREV